MVETGSVSKTTNYVLQLTNQRKASKISMQVQSSEVNPKHLHPASILENGHPVLVATKTSNPDPVTA
jgi:hypothetical protein